MSLEKALKLDLGLALKFLSIPETIEGIRARIIDKDGAPKWSHKNIYDVPNEEIEKLIELG
ncbi:MAG: enoyl-CoA hydratase/isomerase family protein [Holosporaceae bacterium]|nr:MAG: enoyl-CoA hydratase/isomerase family protein [Holosporaceae bacterium]